MTVADREPFQTVVETHQRRTFRAAYRVLANREEALDVTQEAFLALHLHADSVREGTVGGWLMRVATNRALDRVRRRKHVRFSPALDEAPAPAAPDAVERAEERERVMAALARLPERQRQVVTMRTLEQLTFPEIRRALGISEGAAKVHFRRGLAALRRELAGESR